MLGSSFSGLAGQTLFFVSIFSTFVIYKKCCSVANFLLDLFDSIFILYFVPSQALS